MCSDFAWLTASRSSIFRLGGTLLTGFICFTTNARGSDEILERYYREIFVPSVKLAYSQAVHEEIAGSIQPTFNDIERLYRSAGPKDRPTLAIFLMIKADYQGEYAFRFARLIRGDLDEIRKRIKKIDKKSLDALCRLLNADPAEALRRIRYFESGQLN
jgi:hypothetical protein